MKNSFLTLFAIVALTLNSCQTPSTTKLDEASIIPIPSSISSSSGVFKLGKASSIQLIGSGEDLSRVGNFLAEKLRPATGFDIPVSTESGDLVIELISGEATEKYSIDITSEQVKISSTSAAGLFYGMQTLVKSLPVAIENLSLVEMDWIIGNGTIEDEPEFSYRGAMLDVARHFISVEDVKHYIDQMGTLKLNYLHLHLSDDQGWRIEIKSWPKLTEIGGKTEVGGTEGGFYTQGEYTELVNYAADRFITVVPEIDMPGHTNAALAAYAELNPGVNLPDGDFATLTDGKIDFNILDRNPQPAEIYTGIEVGFSTFATNKEITYTFVEDVIREIVELTPGPYFHIGGDESLVTDKDDYIYFIERVQEIVTKYGKKSIGWDEIATAKLSLGTVAQFWAKDENAKLAKEQGNQILMSPAKRAYLDMQYDSTSRLGLHWAAYIELDDAYNWDPATYADGINKSDILGVEAPLWTETIDGRADIEYMAFPRLAALAEVAWSSNERRDWEDFQRRIIQQGKRWDINEIGFYRSPKVKW
ncbi:hexosaminidase [Algoriphagus ratkowskyi]|uniref:beta-N-acetylhexosaminidase n=1 Tax=Algoriphagus ratkowskyi TaxID=57028 RepID=A0A2W7R8F6_9BACT|nr:family 20 glycosylhydrolase [Algoriphagus ratkowskyi]PZX55396.1 hexosaminidase [Algoriphagus ratkowskyi]TXD79679.1 family 20 glycosylhydrolase [Algoriphagus ratkowskyi]